MLKETTGAFDGSRTHDLHVTSQTCNPLRHADPYIARLIPRVRADSTCGSNYPTEWFMNECSFSAQFSQTISAKWVLTFSHPLGHYSSICTDDRQFQTTEISKRVLRGNKPIIKVRLKKSYMAPKQN